MGKSASSPEDSLAVESMQAERKVIKEEKFADFDSQSCTAGYGSSRFPGRFAASAAFKKNVRLPWALPDEDVQSLRFFFCDLSLYTFVPEKHRASLFFPVEEAQFLKKLGLFKERISTLKNLRGRAETRLIL